MLGNRFSVQINSADDTKAGVRIIFLMILLFPPSYMLSIDIDIDMLSS